MEQFHMCTIYLTMDGTEVASYLSGDSKVGDKARR